jgi:hypothetical protein
MKDVFGVRDVVWGAALCGALMFVFHYRPLWGARHFVRTDSEDAFRAAYRGRRWVGGEIIAPRGESGGVVDPAAWSVRSEDLHIIAEELNWTGSHAELVVRHRIVIDNGEAKEMTAYVKLDRRGGRWHYEHFEVRGKSPHEQPITGNPFRDEM